MLNLSQVIKGYKKYNAFREEFKSQFKVYEDKMQGIKKLQDGIAAEAQNPKTDVARREQLEKEHKNLQRQMQDLSDEMKTNLGKKEADQLVIVYKEIQEASQYYARARDLEMVLHYNDHFPNDEYNPMNMGRKLTTDALMPIYTAPGMDITGAVTQMLNDRYDRMANPAGGAAPAAPRQ